MKFLKNLNTEFIGQNIMWYEYLSSTQAFAHELIKEKEDITNGTVIITDNQTSGKGTNDRVWYSEPNTNLTFTIILYPNCDVQKLENITVKIAEVIQKVIYDLYEIQIQIKHPNDLVLNSKKIGGILTESKTRGNTVNELVIGIGMNINQEVMPKEIHSIATSLRIEKKKSFNKEEILTKVLSDFEKSYLNMIKY